MKVYVVTFNYYDDNEGFWSVHLTREGAEKDKAESEKKPGMTPQFSIEEVDLLD